MLRTFVRALDERTWPTFVEGVRDGLTPAATEALWTRTDGDVVVVSRTLTAVQTRLGCTETVKAFWEDKVTGCQQDKVHDS